MKEIEDKIRTEREKMGMEGSKEKEIDELRNSIKEKEEQVADIKKTIIVARNTNP